MSASIDTLSPEALAPGVDRASEKALRSGPRGAASRVLPLPLVAFERYMLADDRESHPMTFTIRLKFSGQFDETAFRLAAVDAALRHPLLHAHVTPAVDGQLTWVAAPDPTPYLDIASLDEPLRFPGSERIDLSRATGLRIWVRTGSERTEMRLQFHHSSADGVGAYQFIEDLLSCYALRVHPDDTRAGLRPLDERRLLGRTTFGLSWARQLLRLPLELWGFFAGSLTFFIGRPVALESAQKPAETPEQRLRLLDYPAYTFAADESRNLLDHAKQAGATLNDLLLRDHLRAMHRWNVRHDGRMRRKMLRIMVPIDLRVPGDEAMPSADVVSMVYIDRWPFMWRSGRFLLSSIAREMAFLKWGRLGLSFVRGVGIYGWFPGGIDFLARAGRCYASAVLSNLGVLFRGAILPRENGKLRAGDLTLERVESAPPVRPFTAAGITTLSYAGQLTIVMNYDRHHWTADEAGRMLDEIVAELRVTAAEQGAAKGTLKS